MKTLLFLVVFYLPVLLLGQETRYFSIGARIGLAYSFGTHTNAFGFCANAYCGTNHIQLNVGGTYKFNFTGLGARKDFTESLMNMGFVIHGGKKTNPISIEFSSLNHQTHSPYSLAYSYNWYLDGMHTQQRSGSWKFEVACFSLTFENDLFGGQGKDRFRTGALVLSYRDSAQSFSIGAYLWTGETKGGITYSVASDDFPNGYKDLSSTYLGKTSHGIFAIAYTKRIGMYSAPTFRLGIDSERVRHIFQNKISHNLANLPLPKNYKSVYYPMLNSAGLPTLNGAHIRRSKPYFQYSLNDQSSYI